MRDYISNELDKVKQEDFEQIQEEIRVIWSRHLHQESRMSLTRESLAAHRARHPAFFDRLLPYLRLSACSTRIRHHYYYEGNGWHLSTESPKWEELAKLVMDKPETIPRLIVSRDSRDKTAAKYGPLGRSVVAFLEAVMKGQV